MIFVWTTGIYPANTFEFYGVAAGENWIGAFTAPSGAGAGSLLLLHVGR